MMVKLEGPWLEQLSANKIRVAIIIALHSGQSVGLGAESHDPVVMSVAGTYTFPTVTKAQSLTLTTCLYSEERCFLMLTIGIIMMAAPDALT